MANKTTSRMKQQTSTSKLARYYYLPQTYLIIAFLSLVVTIPLANMIANMNGAPSNAEGIDDTIGFSILLGIIIVGNLVLALTLFIVHFYKKTSRHTNRTIFNVCVILWLVCMLWLGFQQYDSLMNTPPGGYPGFTF